MRVLIRTLPLTPASGEFAFGADSMVFDTTMLFTGYNEPVEIPAPPADAVSLADFFNGLFGRPRLSSPIPSAGA